MVAIDSTPYMGTLNEFTRTLIVITAIGVLFVALLGFVIARIGMRPVNKLSEQAQHLAPGNHGQRLDTLTLPDELQNWPSHSTACSNGRKSPGGNLKVLMLMSHMN